MDKKESTKYKANNNRVIKNTDNKELLAFKKGDILNLDLSSKEIKNVVDILVKKGYITKL